MKAESSKALISQIMGLNASEMATGASAAGYFGITSNRSQAVLDLKRTAAEFAAETQKAKPDQAKIKELTGQIEAGLRTLYALNIIDQKKLSEILTLLN
jgi:hypothetical protein